MNHRILEDLYDATEEDLLYGVGLLALPDQEPAPFIHIHYRDWPREQLEIVRESFRAGLVLTIGKPVGGVCSVHISTREYVAVQATEGDHTSVLRAPAWDAHLEGIAEQVVRRFEVDRRRYGGFLLLLQTRKLEFLTAVEDAAGLVNVGPILRRSLLTPVHPSAWRIR